VALMENERRERIRQREKRRQSSQQQVMHVSKRKIRMTLTPPEIEHLRRREEIVRARKETSELNRKAVIIRNKTSSTTKRKKRTKSTRAKTTRRSTKTKSSKQHDASQNSSVSSIVSNENMSSVRSDSPLSKVRGAVRQRWTSMKVNLKVGRNREVEATENRLKMLRRERKKAEESMNKSFSSNCDSERKK